MGIPSKDYGDLVLREMRPRYPCTAPNAVRCKCDGILVVHMVRLCCTIFYVPPADTIPLTPVSHNLDLRHGLINIPQILRSQLDLSCADVFLQALQPARPRDRNDPRFCASSQANAIWAGVAFFSPAIRLSRSTTAWFALIASGVNRGLRLRISDLSKVVLSSILPVRYPRPSGL